MAQDPLGPRYAVWFPGKNASETLSNAALITWSVSGTHALLTFPGWRGNPAIIIAPLPVPPAYPPYALPIQFITASSSQSNYPPINVIDGDL